MLKFINKYVWLIASLPWIVVIVLFLTMCTKSAKEKSIIAARDAAYTACHDRWSMNDTTKTTALIIIKAQFMKIDQASMAPTTASGAIALLCSGEADKAEETEKQRIRNGGSVR